MQLEDRTCILTGASGGIGAELADALVEKGVNLVLVGRSQERLQALASRPCWKNVLRCHVADLSQSDSHAELLEVAVQEKASILINLFGCNQFGLLEQQTPEQIDTLIRTNLIAPIQLTHSLLAHLKSQKEAMIVNVGSAFGAIGYPGYSTYSASKFGVRGFSESLAREVSDSSLKIIYVSPRATSTTMNSQLIDEMNARLGNKIDQPKHVAHRIIVAMQRSLPRSGIGWPERFFARLNAFLPSVVDRAIAKQLPIVKAFASRNKQHIETPVNS